MARKLAAIHCIDYHKTLSVLGQTEHTSIKPAILNIIDMMKVLVPDTADSYEDLWKEEM